MMRLRRRNLLLSALAIALAAGCGSDPDAGDDGATSGNDESAATAETAPRDAAVDVPATATDEPVETTPIADPGDPVSIVGLESFEADVPVSYELSPDGRHVAMEVDDALCLFAVDRIVEEATSETASACVDDVPPLVRVRWSPDSTKVVFGADSFRILESASLQVLGVDGSVSTIAEPTPATGDVTSLDGAPIHPVFVDAETVAFGRIVGRPATFDVFAVDVTSGDERLVGTIPRTDVDVDEAWLPRWSWEPSAGELLVSMGGFETPVSLWTLDLDSGEATQVDVPPTRPDADREPGWMLHERTGRLGLVVDLTTMSSFGGRSDSPAWWLYDFEEGASGSVGVDVDPTSDAEYVRFATVSPDEATVAVVVVTRVDGGESVALLAAPTSDVLGGTADWTGIDLPEGAFGGADLTDSVRSLAWNEDLVYKSRGTVHIVATG